VLLHERKNRITGTTIEVWDNRDQSLAEHDGDENWYTICHDLQRSRQLGFTQHPKAS